MAIVDITGSDTKKALGFAINIGWKNFGVGWQRGPREHHRQEVFMELLTQAVSNEKHLAFLKIKYEPIMGNEYCTTATLNFQKKTVEEYNPPLDSTYPGWAEKIKKLAEMIVYILKSRYDVMASEKGYTVTLGWHYWGWNWSDKETERERKEEIYEELLDYALSGKRRVAFLTIEYRSLNEEEYFGTIVRLDFNTGTITEYDPSLDKATTKKVADLIQKTAESVIADLKPMFDSRLTVST